MTVLDLHPTGLHPECLSAQLLDLIFSKQCGLEVIAAVSETIAADCRFNMWVCDELKVPNSPLRGEEDWISFIEGSAEADELGMKAIRAFSSDKNSSEFVKALSVVTRLFNERSIVNICHRNVEIQIEPG